MAGSFCWDASASRAPPDAHHTHALTCPSLPCFAGRAPQPAACTAPVCARPRLPRTADSHLTPSCCRHVVTQFLPNLSCAKEQFGRPSAVSWGCGSSDAAILVGWRGGDAAGCAGAAQMVRPNIKLTCELQPHWGSRGGGGTARRRGRDLVCRAALRGAAPEGGLSGRDEGCGRGRPPAGKRGGDWGLGDAGF